MCSAGSRDVYQQIVQSSKGSSSLQNAVCYDTSSSFLNGPATTLLLNLFEALALGNVLRLDHLLIAIVNPPIFWAAFYQV